MEEAATLQIGSSSCSSHIQLEVGITQCACNQGYSCPQEGHPRGFYLCIEPVRVLQRNGTVRRFYTYTQLTLEQCGGLGL